MAEPGSDASENGSGLRFKLGAAIFGLGVLAPLLVPAVTATDLSTQWKAGLSGLLLVGIPELGMLIAVAIMGKQGYATLKALLARFFRQVVPAQPVGRTRHRIGVALFVVPLVMGWIFPYAIGWIPEIVDWRIALGIAGDGLLAASLIVLGGPFWEKLGDLFRWRDPTG